MRRARTTGLVGLISLSCWLLTCSIDLGVGPGGGQFGVTLLGKTFTLTLGEVGPMAFEAHVGITVPTAFQLFESPPDQVPASGRLILPSSSIAIGQRLDSKVDAQSQTLPLYGSGVVRLLISPGVGAELCPSATLLGQFDFRMTAGLAGIIAEEASLSAQALQAIAANDVTICVEINADFDGELRIGEFQLAFDDADGNPPGDSGGSGGSAGGSEPPPPGTLLQVPIASEGGIAIRAGVNRVVNGVNYGVVGVLESVTPDVPIPTANPETISVYPAALGLATVTQIYMAVHSSFVPDVANGSPIATLTATYAGGTETTLDFVVGQNTAEWSYGRSEHVTAFGGVRHAMASPLYSFQSTVDSAAEYTAYSYAASLELVSSRTLSHLALTMTPPSTYAAARAENAPEPTWAGQALTAITLVGPALPPPPEPDPDEACCTPAGACADQNPGDCQYAGGTALGPGTTCVADAALCEDVVPPVDEPDDPTGACCRDDGTCVVTTELDCLLDELGDYLGDDMACDAVACGADDPLPEDEFVIWYTGNVCCWGAPLMHITNRATFNAPRTRSSFPGGGIDPTVPALKVEVQGGFDSLDAARAWICPQFTAHTFHYWCGRHYHYNGRNWQPGGLGCDFSSLPEVSNPPGLPAPDVCAEHAGDPVDDTIACCYENTTCAEQSPADCAAAGGIPHPDGHTSCGVSPCPDPCPEDGRCVESCGDTILARDPDCDRCDLEGTCIDGCASGDPDCCLGMNVVQNGGAEAGIGAVNFTSIIDNIPYWNAFQGNLTVVSYSAAAPGALDTLDSLEIEGGKNYFAGGPAGISPAIAQNLIFLTDFAPKHVIESGRVVATLSADIGGWATHPDDVIVTATFRDELINDVAEVSIGPVSSAERNNDSRLLHRCDSVDVPPDAVTAEVRIIARRVIGTYNDGYVDNISLVLEHLDCPGDAAGCE